MTHCELCLLLVCLSRPLVAGILNRTCSSRGLLLIFLWNFFFCCRNQLPQIKFHYRKPRGFTGLKHFIPHNMIYRRCIIFIARTALEIQKQKKDWCVPRGRKRESYPKVTARRRLQRATAISPIYRPCKTIPLTCANMRDPQQQALLAVSGMFWDIFKISSSLEIGCFSVISITRLIATIQLTPCKV